MQFVFKNKIFLPVIKWVFWSIVSIAVILTATVAAVSVNAATVTSANDVPTSLQTSQTADHALTFTTPSGAAETENITVTFDSGFDTSSLTEDDIDISDDTVDLTTAPDCSGAEQASVSIAANIVNITICPGDGGAIAASSVVTIEIGSNAQNSGSGLNQVINPSSAGTYFVTIAGTFGDSGSIALPISSTGNFSVTGNAPTPVSGGGSPPPPSPPPPPADSTPPVISNIIVSNITETTADISWDTNEVADGKVDYGFTETYGVGTEVDANFTLSRIIELSDLTAGTEYHFKVRSADNFANEAESGDFTFSTVDSTEPIISNVQVIDITETSVRIIWETNEPATSQVNYGLTDAYGDTQSDESLVTSHSVLLTDLTYSSEYHFQVTSSDASLNQTVSTDLVFNTVSNPAPANVTDITAQENDQEIIIFWTNPLDGDLAGVIVVVCTNEPPSGVSDSDCYTVYDGLNESFTHSGLTNDITYYYGVFPYDSVGQFASGSLISGMPRGPVEEVPDEEVVPDEDEEIPVPDEESGGVEEVPVSSPDQTPSTGPTDGGQTVICGNGICERGEDSNSCPSDCPAEELPPTTADQLVPMQDIEFYVANGSIALSVTDSGVTHMLGNRDLRVQLLAKNLTKDIDRVQLAFGSSTYLMAPNFSRERSGNTVEAALVGDDAYVADLISPETPASYLTAVSIFYTDQTSQTLSFTSVIEADGYAFEQLDGGQERLDSATATLYEAGNNLIPWDGSPYGQYNPVTTNTAGTFSWYVPNGNYVVRVEKEGYEPSQTDQISISDNIVNPVIQLSLVPIELPIEEEEEEITVTALPAVLAERAEAIIAPVTQAFETLGTGLETVRSVPGVTEAAEVSVPALAVTAVASSAVLTVAFDFLPFLQYIFGAPILFFWRRRRKGFGVVYHSVSKTPVDLAVVRLFELPDEEGVNEKTPGKLIRSRVTDKGGRYFFLVQPGLYRMTVTKAGYSFPTEYLQEVKDDGEFLDLYHGEVIKVTEKDAVITANIPLDSKETASAQTPKKIIWKRRLRLVQQVVALIGVFASVIFAIIRPSMLAVVMVGIQIVMYLLVRRLAAVKKPKSWGIVYDQQTGRPLSQVVARIFEPKYNKLLETRVTDSQGRYSFLLGPEEYYVVFEKEGFESKEIRPIDYKGNNEPKEFGSNIKLSPIGISK